MKRWTFLIFLNISIFITISGNTQTSEEKKAKAKFFEGIELYKKGEYPSAAAKMLEAYSIMPSPAFLYNIGIIYEKMGELKLSLLYFKKFYDEGAPKIGKEVVAKKIAEIEFKLKVIEEMKVRKEPLQRRIDGVSPSESVRENIVNVIFKKEGEKEKKSIWKWLTLGIAGSFLAGGGVFSILTKNKYDEAEKFAKQNPYTIDNEKYLSHLKSKIRPRAIVADVCFGIGIASSIITIYLFLSDKSSSQKKSVYIGGYGFKDREGFSLTFPFK